MKIKILFLITFILLFSDSYGQNSKTEMALYNVGLGSIFSGVGALINKEPEEKWTKVLLKGMGQGALGGYLIYESKNLIGDINNERKWEYSWYAKVVNSAGVSIVENASSNRDFWEKWHINFGFNRVEFYTKDKFRVKYKIMPVSLILGIYTAVGNKFELGKSLQIGEIVFSNTVTKFSGRTYGNILLIEDKFLDNHTLYSHEIIHIYQKYDFNFVNTYFNKPYSKWSEDSKTFSKINDLLYIDLNGLILHPLYLLENANRDCYYDNFFENEAGFYAGFRPCN